MDQSINIHSPTPQPDYRELHDKYLAIRNVLPDMLLRIAVDGLLRDCVIPPGFSTVIKERSSGEDTIVDILPRYLATKYMRYVHLALVAGERQTFQYRIAVGGSMRYREVRVIACDNRQEVIALVRDNTDRREMETRLRKLSMRDSLTGLYNRAYFEEEMRRLEDGRYSPVGIIICDIDGLKLINDSLGHLTGDVHLKIVAGILRNCFRKGDVVARIGGDEFAVIMPHCRDDILEQSCQRIRRMIEENYAAERGIPLTVSLGYATSGPGPADLAKIFQAADNNMYREKLHSSLSTRSAIVEIVMRLLEARDFVTEGHVERIGKLVERFGKYMRLPAGKISELRLLAQFHDIGKVGIPDRILFKPGPLTDAERQEVKRHSEIGHRIAQASTVLCPLADLILKHHEWWDGQGYPLGLAGKQVPLQCRMLAIADAFDAMTSDRPYRKAMPTADALAELAKCAGSQFDPELTRKFIRMIEGDIKDVEAEYDTCS